MQMVVTVFGLLGVALVAWPLWIGLAAGKPPRHRLPPMPDVPRVQRRGFGTHLVASRPARLRRWRRDLVFDRDRPWRRTPLAWARWARR